MIAAGEASGDAHAAALVRALREAAPGKQIDFFGSTGAQMRSAGVASIVKADELAILGLWEIGQALPKFWRAFGELKRAVIEKNPDAVILVDWPDFNLRLARWLHRRGVRVIYYISPQLWAWRSYRVHGFDSAVREGMVRGAWREASRVCRPPAHRRSPPALRPRRILSSKRS